MDSEIRVTDGRRDTNDCRFQKKTTAESNIIEKHRPLQQLIIFNSNFVFLELKYNNDFLFKYIN